MARFHGRGLDPARRALLAACAGFCMTQAAGAETATGMYQFPVNAPWTAMTSADPVDPFDRAGSIPPIPEALRSLPAEEFWSTLWGMMSEEASEKMHFPLSHRVYPQRDECFPGASPAVAAAREASVLLIGLYEDGSLHQGTGTIIRSQDGIDPDRILTAAHVVEPLQNDSPLIHVLVFSADGRRLAQAQPLLLGDHDIAERIMSDFRDNRVPSALFNDVAVLAVEGFAPGETLESWNMRGLRIAPEQPQGLIAAREPDTSFAFNTGTSGASILDRNGEVIGVTVYAAANRNSIGPLPDAMILDLMQREGDHLDGINDRLERAVSAELETGSRAAYHGSRGLAVPIINRDLRAVLGLSDAPFPRLQDHEAGIVAGYPRFSCTVTEVQVTTMPEWRVDPDFDPQRALYFDQPDVSYAFATPSF